MIGTFKEFLENIITEELHPELHKIVTSKSGSVSKQTQLANKVQELTAKGEKTGIEGNMPHGSSRAYMKHDEPHHIMLDGKPANIPVGTKVAIRSALDKHHNAKEHEGKNLGAMQNKAEGGDHWVNNSYRVLTQHPNGKKDHFVSNHERGIFPPLVDHDNEHHEWTKVGHSHDLTKKKFKEMTKTESHPEGISHDDFVKALVREHAKNNGKYWEGNKEHEKHMDHVLSHPLTEKFNDYHGTTGHPPHDLGQIKNMGVFHHPDGPKHIVSRDHGFSTEVADAYAKARRKKNEGYMNKFM